MKKLLKSPWTIGISTTLLGFFLTVGYDLLKGKQVFTTVEKLFSMLWNCIVAFLTFDLKVWWVLIGIVVLFLALYFVAKRGEAKPEYTNYTEDQFCFWKWSWEWAWNSYRKSWEVVNLRAHCPKCDTPMGHDSLEAYYQCPRCRFISKHTNHEKSYEVKAVIIDNVNRQI